MRGCDECKAELGMLVQGDWRVDDSTGCAYCDDCWLNWELALRSQGVLGLALSRRFQQLVSTPGIAPTLAAFLLDAFWEYPRYCPQALNSWSVLLTTDLVPFLRGAELYSAMCTGRACFINLAFKVILLRRLADARRVQLLAVGHFTAGSGGDDQEALQ